jgi:hypothetical protein
VLILSREFLSKIMLFLYLKAKAFLDLNQEDEILHEEISSIRGGTKE